jgi:flagellin-like hook-associated protein FlgL
MINNIASATRTISSIYAASSQELASVMAKIATGKRYVKPGDDFTAFIRANNFEKDIQSYDLARTSIGAAKVYTDTAQNVGGQIYANLVKMAGYQQDYAVASAEDQPGIASKFDSLKATTENLRLYSAINGTILASGTLPSFNTGGTSGTTLSISLRAIATDASALNVGDSGTASTAATEALNYLTDAQGWAKTIDSLASLTDTIIASKQAAIEEVAGINEAEELARVTDLQVRQQASISMMAQASISGQRIAYLFGGG